MYNMANGKVRRNQTFNNVLKSINQYMGGQTEERQDRTQRLIQEIESLRKMKPRSDDYKVIGKNLVRIPGEGGGPPVIVDLGKEDTMSIESIDPDIDKSKAIGTILPPSSDNEPEDLTQFRTTTQTRFDEEDNVGDEEYKAIKTKAESYAKPFNKPKEVTIGGVKQMGVYNNVTKKFEAISGTVRQQFTDAEKIRYLDVLEEYIQEYNGALGELKTFEGVDDDNILKANAQRKVDALFPRYERAIKARDILMEETMDRVIDMENLGKYEKYKVGK
tara:strand:- start:181 stop:1005 length:825 start_codon:yes stop_codon:yes gene_type:complete